MSPRDLVYVGHMLDMARKAVAKTRGLAREAYDADENLRLALIHLVQVIGEAARQVSNVCEEFAESRANPRKMVWRRGWESSKSFSVRLPILAADCQRLLILPVRRMMRFAALFVRLPAFADLAGTTALEMELDATVVAINFRTDSSTTRTGE